VGLFNAAVWFGAAIFFLVSVEPATISEEMKGMLGSKNSPYFSIAIGQLLVGRYFHFFLGCSVVAALHLTAEWLYFGKSPQRFWFALLVALWVGGAAQVWFIQPTLKEQHRLQFTRPAQREGAARAYQIWHGVSESVNILVLVGLGGYLWRIANPPDGTRFVSATKFHS
jgi:hypothetical protein